MEDPASLLQFESAVILTEELHQSLTRHPHALYLILCLLQTLLSHLHKNGKTYFTMSSFERLFYFVHS